MCSIISSRPKKRSKYISCRARFDMRAVEDSRLNIKLPLSWSLARCNSSAGTVSFFSRRNAVTTESTTLEAASRDVPAYTERHPVSRNGFNSLKIERSEEHTSELQSRFGIS